MAQSIGIDFGTGNTVLAFNRGKIFQVFDAVGDKGIVPSDILKGEDGILPDPKLLLNPPADKKIHRGIKRDLLKSIDHPDDFNKVALTELAVARLKYIYDAFVEEHGEPFNAVLSCPANTGQAYREILLEIGSRVGLPRVDIVDEPTSAAISHGVREVSNSNEDWLVVDWGCGTCDVSLIKRVKGSSDLQVVHVEGENDLGGIDMDNMLLDYLASRFNFDKTLCPLSQVETLKKQLSELESIKAKLKLSNGTEIVVDLTRTELEAVIEPLLNRVHKLIVRAMEAAEWDFVDKVIATGGPIHMPSVRQTIMAARSEVEGDEITEAGFFWTDPLTSVASGAARLADLKRTGGFAVPTKVTKTIGIRTMQGKNDDVYYPVIRRGETRPITKTLSLTSSIDLQDVLDVEIREGDYEHTAQSNTLLGQLRVVMRPENKGAVKVQLRLHLNDAGRLEASAQAIGDANAIRGVNFVGIATEAGANSAISAELRLDDPVSEFQANVSQRELDQDTARQLYERLKIKYHPDRDPSKKDYWNECLKELDIAFGAYQAEIERRIRAGSLPNLPWNDTTALTNTVVDEVLAQRLSHCLAMNIRDEADPQSAAKITWLLKRFPDYRRVVASYVYSLGRSTVLQKLLSDDDRPHVGFVVLLQNVPNRTIRERHEVLKAAYRMPAERVRELLLDDNLDIEALYELVKKEAPEASAPAFGGRNQVPAALPKDGNHGLIFSYESGNTYITGNTFPYKELIKQSGCRWDGQSRRWVATGKRLTEKDIFPDA